MFYGIQICAGYQCHYAVRNAIRFQDLHCIGYTYVKQEGGVRGRMMLVASTGPRVSSLCMHVGVSRTPAEFVPRSTPVLLRVPRT